MTSSYGVHITPHNALVVNTYVASGRTWTYINKAMLRNYVCAGQHAPGLKRIIMNYKYNKYN